jgi:nucleoside-diphosphate-sugar epimerase
MDNVLITGASGFIGSFLVEEGLKRKYQVYAGIRKTSSRGYLKDPGIRFVEFDFSTKVRIIQTLEQCKTDGIRFNYIIHNAGLTKARKKEEYTNVNFLNTKNFIEALVDTEMVPEKFIYISSLAAYGPGHPVTMKPVMLSDTPKPIELYGKSKLAAEEWLKKQEQFPWIIIRPTGVYGPREKDYFVFFQTINRGMEAYIGSSGQILTFIYVRDLARVIFDALVSTVLRKAYFVTDGKECTAREFSDIAKKHLHKKTFRFVVPSGFVRELARMLEGIYGIWGGMPTLNRDKFNVLNSRNWRCEVEKLQNDFNFEAEYDLDRGVEETISWYKQEKWLK